jgi:hypothetical protein
MIKTAIAETAKRIDYKVCFGIIDDDEKLLYELRREYSFLAALYNDFHAGDASTERLKWEYGCSGGLKDKIDSMGSKAKEKYRYFFEDMGLWNLIENGIEKEGIKC